MRAVRAFVSSSHIDSLNRQGQGYMADIKDLKMQLLECLNIGITNAAPHNNMYYLSQYSFMIFSRIGPSESHKSLSIIFPVLG